MVIRLPGSRVVTPEGVLDPGWVEVAGSRIVAVGAGARGGEDVGGAWVLPGFVDLHVHGGGGADVTRSASDMAAAVAFHRAHGTTRTLVSLMAQPVEAMCAQLGWAAELYRAGVIAGVHLEGPFLATARCGAQRPECLLPPDRDVLQKFLAAGQGCVRTMTIAPELPDAIALIGALVQCGVVAAIGHTDASYEQAVAGFAAGASLATHLFNAMGPIEARAPGASVAALDAGAYVELINDGVHVHDALVRLVARSAADTLVLVTDAISATGAGDGRYSLADVPVEVRDGQTRLAGSDRLAGSTLTMDAALRRAVHEVGLPIEVASRAASSTPARVLGLADRTGAIAAGLDADLVVLDENLAPVRVMCRGEWL